MEKNVNFTEEDRRILESYKMVIAGLSDYLGPCYEIVLHSLENLNESVLAIHNGHYTGRTVGSPVTDLALKMLHDIEENNENDFISYFNFSKSKQPMKSSTIAIRGTGGKIIGLICMNLHLSAPMSDFLGGIFNGGELAPPNVMSEKFTTDVETLIESSVATVKEAVLADPSVSAVNKNKEIVTRLYRKGVFEIKDAVNMVASLLGISKNTIYLHLRSIRKE